MASPITGPLFRREGRDKRLVPGAVALIVLPKRTWGAGAEEGSGYGLVSQNFSFAL